MRSKALFSLIAIYSVQIYLDNAITSKVNDSNDSGTPQYVQEVECLT